MADMNDYSGKFKPDMKYSDFSKEALVKLVDEFARAYVAMDGDWFQLVARKVDQATAFDLEIEMYTKMLYPYICKRLNNALNITGNDVEALFKTMQVMPDGGQDMMDMDWDLINGNHGILTVKVCRPLLFIEKEGKGREAIVCARLEQACFDSLSQLTNPAIKVKAIKLPPRKSKDEIACKWEFKLG